MDTELLIVILVIIILSTGDFSPTFLAAILASVWVGMQLEVKSEKKEDDEGLESIEKVVDITSEVDLSHRMKSYKKNEPYAIEGCMGDTLIAEKMKHMSTMPKRSIDARAKFDKYASLHLFDEELHEHQNRRWWDNQDYEMVF